jgi:hypothetical protein
LGSVFSYSIFRSDNRLKRNIPSGSHTMAYAIFHEEFKTPVLPQKLTGRRLLAPADFAIQIILLLPRFLKSVGVIPMYFLKTLAK